MVSMHGPTVWLRFLKALKDNLPKLDANWLAALEGASFHILLTQATFSRLPRAPMHSNTIFSNPALCDTLLLLIEDDMFLPGVLGEIFLARTSCSAGSPGIDQP